MCLQVILDADFVLANSDAPRRNTSPLVKQGIASDRDLSGGTPYLQTNLCRFSINNFIEQNKNFINNFVLLLCVGKFFKQI